ncbi:MAG: site-specific integrase [Bacteriovoracales bacterium]|nr:site-specific integrase [Bacteriovoracales bacterium]
MENQALRNQDRGKTPLPKLVEWERMFFDQLKSHGRSPNTIKNYRTDMKCFNRYLLERQDSLELEDFTTEKVKEYGEFIAQKYPSDNSRRRRIQALRLFFDFLISLKLYRENPVRKIPSIPKFLDIPRPATLPDIQTLWNHLLLWGQKENFMEQISGIRNQIVFLLVYSAGLKVSDLAKLKEDHIDSTPKAPKVLVVPPKRDPYSVPVHPIFVPIYRRYTELLKRGKEIYGLCFEDLFFNANPFKILQGGLSPRGFELIFKDFQNRFHIKITPKSLRQAAVFKWLQKNYSDGLIKEWLGVAPSYSLKLYRAHLPQYPYNEDFLDCSEGRIVH